MGGAVKALVCKQERLGTEGKKQSGKRAQMLSNVSISMEGKGGVLGLMLGCL